jgi:hypothetical protein
MTSIAITANKCASASEVALLVACLMPIPPWTWARLIVARKSRKTVRIFTRITPQMYSPD